MDAYTICALLVAGAAVVWMTRDRRKDLPGIPSIGPDNWLLSWITVLKAKTQGMDYMKEGYAKYKGRVFKIPEVNRWRLMLTTPAQIDEIRMAADDVLSFEEAGRELLQSQYTLGHSVTYNRYHVPIVRAQLTRNIGALFTEIRDESKEAFADAIPESDDWVAVPALATIMKVVCRTSNRVFVGLPLCRDPDFGLLNVMFTLDVTRAGRTLNMFPDFLMPLAAKFLTDVPKSVDRGVRHLEPIIRERYALAEKYGDNWHERPNDMLQWLMDTAEGEEREPRALTLRILTVNFAAIHTSSMSFAHALFTLAANPEYILPMRDEVDKVVAEDGWSKAAMQKMRRVDSFLRECQRMYGLGSLSMFRIAMKDFTFADGTFVPKGTFISATAGSIHRDAEYYEDPEVFNPWRFANIRDGDGEGVKHQLVATGSDYIPFGHGRHACPGRFFAANELKCMMAHVVHAYDVKLEKEGEIPQPEVHTYSSLPNRSASVMFRKRQL